MDKGYAGFWSRLNAGLIDGILLIPIVALFTYLEVVFGVSSNILTCRARLNAWLTRYDWNLRARCIMSPHEETGAT